MWTCFFFSSSFLASDCFLQRPEGNRLRKDEADGCRVADGWQAAALRRPAGYSRAVEGADVAVGRLLLDVGRDDGWVGDAGGVQTVVRGHHVWREPGGEKTV